MAEYTAHTRQELTARRDLLAEEVSERSQGLDALAKELNALVDDLTALDRILGEGSPSGTEGTKRFEQVRRVALLKARPGSGHSGFRDRVRDVVTANPSGMKPAGVTAKLVESGFVQTGKTRLSVRVQNELHRLWKNGELDRTNGEYRPVGS